MTTSTSRTASVKSTLVYLAVDRVAAEAGLGTGASLRQHLTAAVGLSPTAYRRRFRGGEGA